MPIGLTELAPASLYAPDCGFSGVSSAVQDARYRLHASRHTATACWGWHHRQHTVCLYIPRSRVSGQSKRASLFHSNNMCMVDANQLVCLQPHLGCSSASRTYASLPMMLKSSSLLISGLVLLPACCRAATSCDCCKLVYCLGLEATGSPGRLTTGNATKAQSFSQYTGCPGRRHYSW